MQLHKSLLPKKVFDFLKKQVGTGYYEDLIRDGLLNNPHTSLVVIEPEKGLNDRMEEELNGEATLVVTGGLAPEVLPYCRRKAIHAPDLVLEGLYRYWQLNR